METEELIQKIWDCQTEINNSCGMFTKEEALVKCVELVKKHLPSDGDIEKQAKFYAEHLDFTNNKILNEKGRERVAEWSKTDFTEGAKFVRALSTKEVTSENKNLDLPADGNLKQSICPHCGNCELNYDTDGGYLNWECKTF